MNLGADNCNIMIVDKISLQVPHAFFQIGHILKGFVPVLANGFEILSKRFNHSSPAITMRYLGITGDEANENLDTISV
jgi:hypothetical protein